MSKDDFYHFLGIKFSILKLTSFSFCLNSFHLLVLIYFIDESHHDLELPEASYLSHYDQLVQHLVKYHFALKLYNSNHSRVEIEFRLKSQKDIISTWFSPDPGRNYENHVQFKQYSSFF